MTSATENIDALRLQMLNRRRSTGEGQRHRAAFALAERLSQHQRFLGSQHVACYLALDGELSCQPVIEQLWQLGKQCYLPVINFDTEPKAMAFYQYCPGDQLIKNRYGIAEPKANQLIAVEDLDLVIAPLVAFDDLGNRIGMGGGFYDRAFESENRPYLLGVAYEFQRVDKIHPQEWDIPLNEIVAV